MVRSGIGFDVHQLKSGFDLYVGGIKIKSDLGSLGHSDGDALIHAIVDALLGAACLGDIGKYFPSNQKKWKGVESELFLFETKKLLSRNGFQISNIDSTIILQKPRIENYLLEIRKNISSILDIDYKVVSIKATTTDYLGYVGKSKGWSVMSIATINDSNEIN
ncbi:2-C-methyl-D-erythritol 2,4-cyclodiphosphate synthase [Candidatus Marinimicrobia bacterium]|nr:2-C-methyl-D-erythritol 2,4-cyclodiphosphate synthase [Candidatus Neomarinimicrobiota bacterium]|tara:strand:+ start:654 stop:1142 length:489 start_codon:yes stop_codon:yes gene_type:complete